MRGATRPRPAPGGLPALGADERFDEALAKILAARVAARLGSERGEKDFLDAPAARLLASTRRRIHELVSVRPRPDGRRPLYRQAVRVTFCPSTDNGAAPRQRPAPGSRGEDS